jgi:hypothetical protein
VKKGKKANWGGLGNTENQRILAELRSAGQEILITDRRVEPEPAAA